MTTHHLRLPAVAVLLVLFSALAASSQDLSTSFSHFDVVKIDTSRPTLALRAGGRDLVLAVTPHDLRGSRWRAQNSAASGDQDVPLGASRTFKGTVVGDASSFARLTIDGSRVEGYFNTRGERYFIEPAARYSVAAASDEMVVYREDDMRDRAQLQCGSVLQKLDTGLKLAESPTVGAKRFDLATEADREYVNTLGGPQAANAEILSILNMAEGVYESELNVTINVVFQHTWTTADPFAGANPEATVRNFQAYWNQHFPPSTMPRDAAHLFSAKANVQSQGWAFIGVVCTSPDFAYGMSGYVDWAPAKFLVTAHELAHNLGATHVDAPQGCANTLMNAQLTAGTPMTFCQYSRNEVSTYLGGSACLSPLGGCRYDFDGDDRADVGVFRPSTGIWYLNETTGGFVATQFGVAGDVPVAADYDGDNRSDVAVYRAGVWYTLRSSTGTFSATAFGLAGDIPTPADFDGDGRADVAVFRPSNGYWYELLSGGGFAAVSHGLAGDIPAAADYDGDGRADVNVFRPSTGTWYRRGSATGGFVAVQFGVNGDRPIAGDFDGDRRADVAVYRPATGAWYMLFADNSFRAVSFGLTGDIAVAADYDGDGRTDVSVFRPSTAVWYRLNSSNGSFYAAQFGISTDLPVLSN
jgi:hypothetical protein